MPKGSDWTMLYGVSVLTGIGFTMSLFVDALAYDNALTYSYADKLAILTGSFLSATVGYIILRLKTGK